jgi:hypothetical protein
MWSRVFFMYLTVTHRSWYATLVWDVKVHWGSLLWSWKTIINTVLNHFIPIYICTTCSYNNLSYLSYLFYHCFTLPNYTKGELVSLWLCKENNKLWDLLYAFSPGLHNFFNPSEKNYFGYAANDLSAANVASSVLENCVFLRWSLRLGKR